MSGDVPLHRPADADEADALLPADGPPPVVTGSLPDELPDFVRDSLASGGRALLSTERLGGVEEYRPEDLTVTVGPGTRMSTLQEWLGERDQWIPLSSAGLRRSAGGVVAAAPPSPYAGEYGPLRRQVLAVRVLTYDGERLDWGRAVVKNVAGYDMPRLVCGSRARLGLVLGVSFRVWPLPEARRRLEIRPVADGEGEAREMAGATVGVDADEDWRPAAESWAWSAAGEATPPLVVELAGSPPSVRAREERLARWAEARGLTARPRPPEEDEGEKESAGPGMPPGGTSRAGSPPSGRRAASPRPACLRFRVGPRYVADAAAALRAADGTERLVAHPREGLITAHVAADGSPRGVVAAGTGAPPDARVAVDRGRPGLHERVEGLRDGGRIDLERRVVEALGGRRRSWTADFV